MMPFFLEMDVIQCSSLTSQKVYLKVNLHILAIRLVGASLTFKYLSSFLSQMNCSSSVYMSTKATVDYI